MEEKDFKEPNKKRALGPAIDNLNKNIDDRVVDEKDTKNEVKKAYKTKKRMGIVIADGYNRLFKRYLDINTQLGIRYSDIADKIKWCDSHTLFAKCPVHKKAHVVYKRTCKQRLCPVCNFMRSIQNKEKLSNLILWMNRQQDYKYDKYAFVTFTVPNVVADFDNTYDAVKVTDAMYKAFSDMIKEEPRFKPYLPVEKNPECNLRKKKSCELECECKKDGKCNLSNIKLQKPCIKGVIRNFENTYKFSYERNQYESNMHFHTIMAMNATYYKRKRRFKVLNNREWGYTWESYLNRYIDVNDYKMRLIQREIDTKSKSYTSKEIEKKLSEPLQVKALAIVNKKAKKETYLAAVEGYEPKALIDNTGTGNSRIDRTKLLLIQKEMASLDKTKAKYKTVKEAINAWEKDHYNAIGAVAETAKYAQKDSDVAKIDKNGVVKLKDTERAIHVFDAIFLGRRLLTLHGSFKEAQKYLNMKINDEVEEKEPDVDKDCHFDFIEGKFYCRESESLMEFVIQKFNLTSQIYQESMEEEDVKYLANEVIKFYEKKNKKKSDVSDQTNIRG